MLYDNAQLARLYFATYQATGQDFYSQIAEETLEYVLREMTDPLGGFYTTQDADSEGEEGLFFIWTPDEIKLLLGERDGELFCRYYGINPSGNFEGKTILSVARPLSSVAHEMGMALHDAETVLKNGKKHLFHEREKRTKPFRDEKILTSLNGLMIGAFVDGYQITRKNEYLIAAKNAARFITNHLYKDGRLLRAYKDNVAKLNAYLDDYAYFIDALVDLYEATTEETYLHTARHLAQCLIDQFWDDDQGGFFFTSADHETLAARPKSYTDQSVPSGNAVAVSVLLRLFYLIQDQTYFDRAEKTLQVCGNAMEENAFATGNLIAAADFYLRGPKEILVCGKKETPEMETLLHNIYRCYIPNKIVLVIDPCQPYPVSDWMKGKEAIEGRPTVYVCEKNTCSMPMTTWEEIEKELGR
jgi:uncharacterized protein YyaL (SSP411 family)